MTHRTKSHHPSQRQANPWRPHLEFLEGRFAPGEAIIGATLGVALLSRDIAALDAQTPVLEGADAGTGLGPVGRLAIDSLSFLAIDGAPAALASPDSARGHSDTAAPAARAVPASGDVSDPAILFGDAPTVNTRLGFIPSSQSGVGKSLDQEETAGRSDHTATAYSGNGQPIPQAAAPARFGTTPASAAGQAQPPQSHAPADAGKKSGTNGPPVTFDCSVSLVPDKSAPQLVGESITWTASALNCGTNPVYQFSVGPSGGNLQVARDYGPPNSFTWAPMQEGTYDVRVTVKSGFAATMTTSAVVTDAVNSRVTGTEPVVTPTANPLVALFSVPPAQADAVHVNFRPAGKPRAAWQSTDTRVSVPGLSTNFLVAGMLPDTTYEMVAVTSVGSSVPRYFTTGSLPDNLTFPQYTVVQPPGPDSDLSQNMIFHMAANGGPTTVSVLATDLAGNVDWYYDPSTSGLPSNFAVSLVPGGTILMLPGIIGGNVLREVDLAGNVIRQTNVSAINAQLTTLGLDTINGFSHDAQRLPDGKTAVLGQTTRTVTIDGTPRRYLGDMVLVLDQNFQVTWTWNAFDFLDVNRGPIDEDTSQDPVDWIHANAVNWSPADGNLLVSMRNQDWVIKIDYADGTGDGHVIWRLGQDGDFSYNTQDPYPWQTHQHDAHYINDTTVVLFDNGKTRGDETGDYDSRGQVLSLDEQNLTVTPLLNAYLGNYSMVYGAAQELPNGNYVFNSGFEGRPPAAQSIELLPDGTPAYVLQGSSPEYRSFRVGGLYAGDSVPTSASTPRTADRALPPSGYEGGQQTPRVIVQTVGASLGVYSARVTFNERIDPTTFTPDQVTAFTGPNGDIAVNGVVPVAGSDFTAFDVVFDPQTTAGAYSMTIGPGIRDASGNPMVNAYLLNFTLGGPRIVSSVRSGNIAGPVDRVQVTFNYPIDPSTFTAAQVVQFTGPNGDIPVNTVVPVASTDNTQFNIRFGAQGDLGAYSLTIGPDVQDIYGNPLADVYTAEFNIVRSR